MAKATKKQEYKDVKYTLLHQTENSKIDKLMKVYKENPRSARILYFQDSHGYSKTRIVLYERGEDFEICEYTKYFGISVTNRMYSREKKTNFVIYKAGKFYYGCNGSGRYSSKIFSQLTYSTLNNFISTTFSYDWETTALSNVVVAYFLERFSWIRFIKENQILHSTAFNTFTRHKLYSYKAAIRYILKTTAPAERVILGTKQKDGNTFNRDVWKGQLKVLKNIENITSELYGDQFFSDACKMAHTVGEKINCAWSPRRLREEHDKWALEITNTVMSLEDERELKVADIYKRFAKYSGYNLFLTNKEIFHEGMKQHHCVASYVGSVDNGSTGIYHIEGYTLQLLHSNLYSSNNKSSDKFLYSSQFYGHHNTPTPIGLKQEVYAKLLAFNQEELKDECKILKEYQDRYLISYGHNANVGVEQDFDIFQGI